MNFSGDQEQLGVGVASSCSFSPMDSSIESAVSPFPSFSSTTGQQPFAGMDACREFYERRLENLERFRRRLTTTTNCGEQKEADIPLNDGHHGTVQYNRLQSDLMELMENDVNLMRQLMALGERIEELKSLSVFTFSSTTASSVSSPNAISPTSSMISLDGVCCDERDEDENQEKTILDNSNYVLSNLQEEIRDQNHIERPESGVENDLSNEIREDFNCNTTNGMTTTTSLTPRVYFSRQNSILRIPIPPNRNGIRSKTIADLQQHAKNEAIIGNIIKRGHSSACETSSSSDDANSYVSNMSENYRGAGWYAKKKANRDFLINKSGSNILTSKKNGKSISIGEDEIKSNQSIVPPYHASQNSCDSGVHHLNNSVDLFDGEDLIYV